MKKVFLAIFVAVATFTFQSASASAAEVVWNGGSHIQGKTNNLGDDQNWVGGQKPQVGDDIVFTDSGSSYQVLENTLPAVTYGNLIFRNSNGPNINYYTELKGSLLELSGDINIAEQAYLVQQLDIRFTNNSAISMGAKSGYNLVGKIYAPGGSTLTIDAIQNRQLNSNTNVYDMPSFGLASSENAPAQFLRSSGSGNATLLVKGAQLGWFTRGDSPNTTYTIQKSRVSISPDSVFGSASQTLALSESSIAANFWDGTYSIKQSISLNGNLFGVSNSQVTDSNAAINFQAGRINDPNAPINISFSSLAINSDIAVNTENPIIVNLPTTAHDIKKIGDGQVVNGSNVVTPQGLRKALLNGHKYEDALPNESVALLNGVTAIINGERGDVSVLRGGTLKGKGTVKNITLETEAKLAPGESPGCLTSNDLQFTAGSIYEVEIAGNTVCSEYDRTTANGTVTLGDATLSTILLNNFRPTTNAVFTIIDNDGSDAVNGTFSGLPEGSTITVDGVLFQISYVGGDGNDVTLTALNVPTTPNTGVQMITANPLLVLAITLIVSGALFALARYQSLLFKR